MTLGALETAAALRLSPLLAAFAGAHPAVDLVLRTGTTSELIQAVLGHQVEGAFVCGPVDRPDLAQEVVFREELVVQSGRVVAHALSPQEAGAETLFIRRHDGFQSSALSAFLDLARRVQADDAMASPAAAE